MLIRFSVENWMSFRDSATFSMVASRERKHSERVPKLAKYRMRVLPIAAIYGGNASGKTNFFKALNFAKTFVVRGTRPDELIQVDTFRLDSGSERNPSRFTFELLIDKDIYEFSFALNRRVVIEEKLVHISSTNETVLYDRHDGKPNFDASLETDQFLRFAFQGTRDNQLFLTNSVSQKVERFRPIYDWFKDTLELIAPDWRFQQFESFLDEGHPLYAAMNGLLPLLDTGITHLGGEAIPFDDVPLPAPVKTKLLENVKEDMPVRLLKETTNDRYIVSREGDELTAKKLVSYHPKSDGSETKFEMRQESDGTQRVIDLLPAFLQLSETAVPKVFVIDELDRSLHTLLTRQLLEAYLASCSSETRSQLLFTTHDVLLMDQNIFRRDEMWVVERDRSGASTLLSFSDYKDVRHDKDVRKSYLQGRLGGVPRILANCGVQPFSPAENTGGKN
jgi:AAA15 family ATPase/GTPase